MADVVDKSLGALRGLSGPGQARSADRVLRALPAHDHALLLRSAGSRGLATILRGLMAKRAFAQFVEDNQRQPRAGLKQRFEAMWQALVRSPGAEAGKHVSWYWYAGFQGYSGQHPARLSLLLEGALSLFQVQDRPRRCQARQELPDGASRPGPHHPGGLAKTSPTAATNVAISMAGLRALRAQQRDARELPGRVPGGHARAGRRPRRYRRVRIPRIGTSRGAATRSTSLLMCYSDEPTHLNSRCKDLEDLAAGSSTSCNPPRTPASS